MIFIVFLKILHKNREKKSDIKIFAVRKITSFYIQIHQYTSKMTLGRFGGKNNYLQMEILNPH